MCFFFSSRLFLCFMFWRCMWGFSSLTRDGTLAPCIGRRSPNHWTTREVPNKRFKYSHALFQYIAKKMQCNSQVHSFIKPQLFALAWKIPWTEEPGGLRSMGLLGVGHNWATSLSLFTFMHWRRKWQPTPVFLPGESRGRRSQVGCCLWGRTESDTTEVT